MSLTTEDIERLREEEKARMEIRKELNNPKGKSMGVVLAWTFFFGVFGLFYISNTAAWIGILVGIPTVILVPVIGPAIWIISIITGLVLVSEHNKNL